MKRVFIFLLFSQTIVFSQSVYLPAAHNVYKFLDRMEARQFISDYRDEVKPLTRQSIASFLIQMDSLVNKMTEIEREQLAFYKEEFFQELQSLNYDLLLDERWHLYQYSSEGIRMNLDAVGGWGYRNYPNNTFARYRHNGLQLYGYGADNIGGYFYFRDNRDDGTYLDDKRELSSDPAQVVLNPKPNFIEYNIGDAQLTYKYSFVTFSIEKLHNVWGNGENGNLIFSTKSPSYPQIKLRADLGKDITFTYIHAWLMSDVIDSLQSYTLYGFQPNPSDPANPYNLFRPIYRKKYVVAHMFEFTPFNGVDIAVGESEVYGNRSPELLYLIPIVFFKAAEHWMNDSDNSQVFASVDCNFIQNYNFYASVFIDELRLETMFDSQKNHNQLGFTTGLTGYDFFLDNSKFNIEYTRINPWAYNHKYPEVTYQNHSVDMGHWIGQNADLFTLSFNFTPIFNLDCGIKFQSLRKGWKDSTYKEYQDPPPEFLYNPLTKQQSLGFSMRYEFLRNFVCDLQVNRVRFTTQDAARGKDYAGKYDLYFGIRYNVW